MPKTRISEYSTTNSANTDIESINIDEGCAPSGINNAIRELMVHLKEFQTGASGDAFTFAGGVLISGTANTITGNVLMSGTVTSSNDITVNGVRVGEGAGSVATNTALGASALAANTTGANNTAVGYQALDANTTGGVNTAIGSGALGSNTTGAGNTAVGFGAIASNTVGTNNTAVGRSALDKTTASDNTGVGYFALVNNTTGTNNTALGSNAMNANTTGANNTAVGYGALDSNTTGANNVAVGAAAMSATTTGTYNSAFGRNAGEDLTTGSNNTLIGQSAGLGLASLTTGSNNVMIGPNSYATAGAVNQIVIGTDILVGQGDNYFTFGKTGNRVYNQYTVDANWARTSDGRLKRNVNDMSLGLSFINKLRPVSYQWKPSYEVPQELVTQYNEENKMDLDVVMHGFIAQEVKAALDEIGSIYTCGVWSEGSDGTQAVSREMFIMPLVKAIQELSAKCDALQAEVNQLKGN